MSAFIRQLLLLFFVLSSLLSAQHITDILINDEPDTNAFKTTSASLHVLSPKKFMVIWKDDRGIEDHASAQIFDQYGNPIFSSFQVPGDYCVPPLDDDIFSVISFYYSFDMIHDRWNSYYQHFNNNQPLSPEKYLSGAITGMCGTGFTGQGLEMTRTRWGNIFVHNYGGYVSCAIQNQPLATNLPEWNYLFTTEVDSSDNYINGAEKIALFPNADSSFAWLVVSRTNYWNWLDDQPHSNSLQLFKIDSVGQTGNPKTIISDTSRYEWEFNTWLYAELESDSTIVIFWAKKDSLVETHIDTGGAIIEHRAIPVIKPADMSISEMHTFYMSNAQNNKRLLLLGYQHLVKQVWIEDHRIQSVSENYTDITPIFANHYTQNLYLNANGEIFYTTCSDSNAFLYKWQNDQFQYQYTMDRLGAGANQTNPQILPISDNEFMITYKEGKSRAAKLDINGEILAQPREWPNGEGMLFNDGKLQVCLSIQEQDGIRDLVMQSYNTENLQPIANKTLLPGGISFTCCKLDQDFVVMQLFGDHLLCSKFANTGVLIDSVSTQDFQYNNSDLVECFQVMDDKFWTRTNKQLFLWDTHTMQVTHPHGLDDYWRFTPLNEKLLCNEYDNRLTIIDTTGTSIDSIDLNIMGYDKIITLDQDHFMLYNTDSWNGYYSYVLFNSQFEFYQSEPNPFFPARSQPYINFTWQRVGNHLVFACTDIRDDETGENVYASIFNIDDLIPTGINDNGPDITAPAAFTLSAPWPNPGRAGNSLRFQMQVPGASQISIDLYNILGQHVKTMRQFCTPGQQQIRFHLPEHLPTGVYFIKASDAKHVQMKKIMIMR